MHVQRRRHQKQQRRLRRQFAARRNIRTAETPRAHGATPPATSSPAPAAANEYPHPPSTPPRPAAPRASIVSTSIMARSDAENAGTCEYRLARLQPLIDHAHIRHHQRLQPPLRMHAKQRMLLRPVRMPRVPQRGQQLQKERPVAILQARALPRPRQTQFPACCETSPPRHPCAPARTPARASGTQSPPPDSTATSQFGRISVTRAIDSANLSNAAVSFVACTSRVATFPRSVQSISTTESSRSLNSNSFHFAAARFRFAIRSRTSADAPAGTNRISPSKKQLRDSDAPFLPAFGSLPEPKGGIFPAHIKPQNSKRQRRIDRCLRLLRVHSQHRKRRLSLPQQSARINRTKRFLQIHARSQPRNRESRKVPLQRPPQLLLIS